MSGINLRKSQTNRSQSAQAEESKENLTKLLSLILSNETNHYTITITGSLIFQKTDGGIV